MLAPNRQNCAGLDGVLLASEAAFISGIPKVAPDYCGNEVDYFMFVDFIKINYKVSIGSRTLRRRGGPSQKALFSHNIGRKEMLIAVHRTLALLRTDQAIRRHHPIDEQKLTTDQNRSDCSKNNSGEKISDSLK